MPAAARTGSPPVPTARSISATTAATNTPRAGFYRPDRPRTTAAATSSASTRAPATRGCCTASATATNCRRRTTSCSTARAGSTLPTSEKGARDRDHGGLYYALPDGSKIVELVHPMLSPNGIGLSPDEKTVYVADTETSRLFAYDIAAPGVLRGEPFPAPYGGRLVCGLPGFQRFDSLAVEASGNICVATLITGHITVIAPDGRVVRQVKMPDVSPTNICFGGADMKTAYITLSGAGELAATDWPEPGLRLNFTA